MSELLLSYGNWPPLLFVYGFLALSIGFSIMMESNRWKRIVFENICAVGGMYVIFSIIYHFLDEGEQLVPMLIFFSFLIIYSFFNVFNAFLKTN